MVLNDGPDDETIGCGLTAFIEKDEVKDLIDQLKIPDLPDRKIEWNREKFKFILTKYQEQPHLLDPYIDEILNPMLEMIKDESVPDQTKHNAFKYMFILMSVKTYKKIVTHLPHEVIDLLPVLRLLEKQNPTDLDTWETRYVLLIWLSIISKIPFPLSRLETSENVEKSDTILFRILKICKCYCMTKDACPVAAVYLIANFLTRSDVKNPYLEEMIDWCLKCLEEDKDSHGPLAVLASILKHCAREDLKPHCQTLFEKITKLELSNNSGSLVRRYEMKVIQRIGFVLLRPTLAAWRYQRSLQTIGLLTTENETKTSDDLKSTEALSMMEPDDQDIPPIIEDIIEQLIQGLRDKIITIRWSAAKGIGRITSRLPVDLADEIVGFILNLFSGREQDSAWHGGCLALAELGRRGLLLPRRLKDVIPFVSKALVFDEPRAYGSIGAIIRDAACYVCWAFARAFEPQVFQPYVEQISATLLIVTCFDREINCRRAASAAFQENVGRQGNFPHGIDIVTLADYFEVGVRSHAYLKISVFISQYEEYTVPMIEHLVDKKICHWDTAIRELTAKALSNLTSSDGHFMIETVLPILIENTNSIDLNVRHGSVLAIAEILEALNKFFNNNKIDDIIGVPELEEIKKIVNKFKIRGQFKGLGGELMKQACAILIRKLSNIHYPVHSTTVINDWQNLLEECLCHEVTIVKLKSSEAHTSFLTEYYSDNITTPEKRNIIINKYLDNLKSNNQNIRIGFAEAIGYFPIFILKENFNNIFLQLNKCTKIDNDTLRWAESRKKALNSLTMIVQRLGIDNADVWKIYINDMYDCYLLALKEYTIDSRGDIGAWVREAVMSGLHVLTSLISEAGLSSCLSEKLMTEIIGGVAQQAVERIDRTRVQAGTVFYGLIHCQPELPNIPYHDELKKIFVVNKEEKINELKETADDDDKDNEKESREILNNEERKDDINWNNASDTFPRFIKMLNFSPYTDALLRGIIFSVGGLSESLVKYSSVSLFTYLSELNDTRLQDLLNKILDIFEDCHRQERMITAIFAFLDRLLSSGCVQSILDDPNSQIPDRMLQLLKREKKTITNTKLIISIIKVFCQLLQVDKNLFKKLLETIRFLIIFCLFI